jgi:hypothetical protein
MQMRPDPSFAVHDHEQYQPVQALGDQRVRVSGSEGEGLLVCHASRPLDTPGSGAGRLVVVVHGALRDSGRYLEHAVAAAGQAGSAALIVAPQFLAAVDAGTGAGAGEGGLYWDVEGWKGGHPALGPAPLSSFAAMDSLLRQLARPESLPPGGHPAVVIIGNSAGGQFVNRYAAVGRGPDALAERGIAVRFIIANPSTAARGPAWSAISPATSRSSSARRTATATRCCSRSARRRWRRARTGWSGASTMTRTSAGSPGPRDWPPDTS